jgi:DNA-binding transcriptional MerR regulator
MPRTFTTGDLCKRFGVMPWQVLQLMRRGFLPEPPRVGIYRYWTEADLPRVEQALRAAGYLPQTEAAHA